MPVKPVKPVSHVIFDNDGLLLNTEIFYEEAYNRVIKRYGKGEFTWEMKLRQMGRPQEIALQMAIDEFKLPISLDEMIKETDAYLMERYPSSQLMPGAERLIRHLHKHNVPMALCTASKRKYFLLKTSHHKDLYKLFNHVVCIPEEPEIKHGKPSGESYLFCASRFPDPAPCPSSVLVFEDSVNGVQAALNAGMQVVMVPDPRMAPESRLLATQCLNSLLEFRPETFGLPAFQQ
ncbi:HAD 2 domain containing protein [Trichuris trichiura]|uniref:pseudouridine 5'-phosphatase n=1 Tax=Trichuris trichiura TaxID=36087 RepID=A0A077Z2W0_TRITR|nr:HAD 2 domain containing protein [Trichuris trichiura]